MSEAPNKFMEYRAPLSGFYSVKATCVRYEFRGLFTFQENFNWKWWKFWEEKYQWKPYYERVEVLDGSETKYFSQGDLVNVSLEARRIGT